MAISETVFEVINSQMITHSATAVSSTAFPDGSEVVRLYATTSCVVAFGTSPTAASTTGIFMPADTLDYFKVKPGYKVSSLAAGTAGTQGFLSVTTLCRG